jgi:hypothetical protein
MGLLEAALALIGLAALIGAIVYWCLRRLSGAPIEEDLAAPYREALHSATRLQSAARDLEQKMYAEALRHIEGDPGGEQ